MAAAALAPNTRRAYGFKARWPEWRPRPSRGHRLDARGSDGLARLERRRWPPGSRDAAIIQIMSDTLARNQAKLRRSVRRRGSRRHHRRRNGTHPHLEVQSARQGQRATSGRPRSPAVRRSSKRLNFPGRCSARCTAAPTSGPRRRASSNMRAGGSRPLPQGSTSGGKLPHAARWRGAGTR